MEMLIWAGAAVSVMGLAGLIWCIVTVARARRRNLSEAELSAAIQGVLPWNMASLFLSVIGLMMVVVGILLG